jgi:hypothetical protein
MTAEFLLSENVVHGAHFLPVPLMGIGFGLVGLVGALAIGRGGKIGWLVLSLPLLYQAAWQIKLLVIHNLPYAAIIVIPCLIPAIILALMWRHLGWLNMK